MVIPTGVYDFLGKEGTASVIAQAGVNLWKDDGGHALCFRDSRRLKEGWIPPKVEVLSQINGRKRGEKLRLDDIRVGFGGALITNKRGKDVLEDEFENYLEFLPLDCPTEDLWVMHVLPEVKAIDHARSCPLYAEYDTRDLPFKPIGPRVGSQLPYAFFEEKIQHLPLFWDANVVESFFMTDRFVDFVQASGLTGFEPKLRYDSELHVKGFDERGRPIV
jgi:hypothetical protein